MSFAETLFEKTGRYPASVIRVELGAWRAPVFFGELLYALAVLHNRLLSLRKYKEAATRGQILHPASYLAADEQLTVKNYPADGAPLECYAYPAVARTLAAFLAELAAAPPGEEVPFRTLIALFKNEIEVLKKRRYHEDDIRRLLKIDALAAALAGARVSLEESEEVRG